MPELPEVERGRRLAASVAEGRRITRVQGARDPIVFDGTTPTQVRRALTGAEVRAVHRRGKQLWFELDRSPHPLFHFGMTGAFHAPEQPPPPLASSRGQRVDRVWPPRFTKIHLWFDDGGELAMTNKRRLGRIRLRKDPEREPPVSRLGFDPLLDLPSPAAFARVLRGRSVTMKGLLMDQSFAAGVGNWIADEVLYQARIDPRRPASTLNESEARRVRSALRSVVRRAVAVDAVKERFPRTWLFHDRWGRSREARTARGEKIEFLQVAGRTTAWVPSVQR